MSSLDVSSWNLGDVVHLTENGLKHIESNAKPVFKDLPTGVIVDIIPGGSPPIGVSWNVEPSRPLHDCARHCVPRTGWYVYPNMIEKIVFEDVDFEPQPITGADFLRLAYDCAADRSAT